MQRLIQVAGLKALHKLVAAKALGNRHGITAGKARIAVAALGHDLQQALDRKEGQRIGANVLADLIDRLVSADELRLHVGIDAVEARPDDLGRVDADVNLLGAGVAQHLDELHHGGAANDGVVDDDQALALDIVAQWIELHAHAHGTQLLRGLDKRTAHIAILDEALAKGNAALARITLRRRQTGVGHADDQVGIDGLLVCQLTTHVVTAGVDALAIHDGVGAGKVDLLKDAVSGLFGSGHTLLGYQALGTDAQDLAGTDITDILGAHDIECTCLGGNDPAASARDMSGSVDRRGVVLRR